MAKLTKELSEQFKQSKELEDLKFNNLILNYEKNTRTRFANIYF